MATCEGQKQHDDMLSKLDVTKPELRTWSKSANCRLNAAGSQTWQHAAGEAIKSLEPVMVSRGFRA